MAKKPAAVMKRTIEIKYWWKCEAIKGEMPARLKEALDESAQDRIGDMMKQGFTSGELVDDVNMDLPGRKTPKDGWACRGWWSFSIKDTEGAE